LQTSPKFFGFPLGHLGLSGSLIYSYMYFIIVRDRKQLEGGGRPLLKIYSGKSGIIRALSLSVFAEISGKAPFFDTQFTYIQELMIYFKQYLKREICQLNLSYSGKWKNIFGKFCSLSKLFCLPRIWLFVDDLTKFEY